MCVFRTLPPIDFISDLDEDFHARLMCVCVCVCVCVCYPLTQNWRSSKFIHGKNYPDGQAWGQHIRDTLSWVTVSKFVGLLSSKAQEDWREEWQGPIGEKGPWDAASCHPMPTYTEWVWAAQRELLDWTRDVEGPTTQHRPGASPAQRWGT